MTDTMTPPSGGNALSIHDGADALAGLRQPENQPEESSEQQPDAEEEEVEAQDEAPESQESDDESSETEDQESGESLITLKDGTQITVDEAVKGYYRESDYTRDKQALHRDFKAKEAQFQAQSTEYVKRLQSVYDEVVSMMPREPDWSARVDEVGADQAFKEQQQWNASVRALGRAKAEIEQNSKAAMAQAQIKAREVLLSGEFDPAWKDPKVLTSAMEKVSDYLSGYGYDASVLSSVADPNIAIIAEKARRFDELQKAKPEAKKLLKDKPKPLKPGPKQQETPKERSSKQTLNRFHQTKTPEDSLAALASLRAGASS